MQQKIKNRFRSTTLNITFLVIVVGFLSFGLIAFKAAAKDRYTELQLFTKVLNLVQQYYVEPVDTKKLIYGAIKGMLKELDPHTNFLPPEMFKEFESETSGEFSGLGIEMTVKNGVLTVISPVEDTPAFLAGVKAGDKIVSINGESTKGMSLVEAAQFMRGIKGAKVVLGIYRDGFVKPKDIAVTRGTVKLKSVKSVDLEDGYIYFRVTSFIENTSKDFRKILSEHTSKYKNIRGIILDLRKNPGGLLDQAVEISDLFLEQGVIVSTMDRNKKEKQTIYAKSENALGKFPVVVLVDEYSASASEIVAGALQDNKRALIMGQKSFGKGSVQSVVKLGDGSGLKLTVARYYTPSGKSIQAEGISPDVVVDSLTSDLLEKARSNNPARREKDITGHLEADSVEYEEDEDLPVSVRKENKNGKIKNDSFMQIWWGDKDKDGVKNQTPKIKLLKEDFQALQAYNYLRAWKVMKTYDDADVGRPDKTVKQ